MTRAIHPIGKALDAFCSSGKGSVGIFFGLALLPLLLTLGAAVDYQRVVSAKSRLQYAVDAAVLAAANGALQGSSQAQRQAYAQAVGSSNFRDFSNVLNATFTETESGSGVYTVSATASVNTTVMKIAMMNSFSISATASASLPSTETSSVCLLTKYTLPSTSLLVEGGMSINAPECEFDISTTAILTPGDTINLKKLCVGMSWMTAYSINYKPSSALVQMSCPQAADPFAGKLPSVSVGACDYSYSYYYSSANLSPGVYCGGLATSGVSGTLNLAPGLYIIKNSTWNISSNWTVTGTGVTFYLTDSSSWVQFNGNARGNLSAPVSGTYANILMFEPPTVTLRSNFILSGSSATPTCFSGLIYTPSRDIMFNSPDANTTAAITVVALTATFNSATTWNITSSPLKIASASSSVAPSTPRLLH